MVNGINAYEVSKIEFKPNKVSSNYCTGPNCSPAMMQGDLNGTNAIANYNIANFNIINKLEVDAVEPIKINPEDVDKIDGEKIYTSDNKLYAIVQEDDSVKTIYNIDKENHNKVTEIVKQDKKTGKNVFQQTFNQEKDENGKDSIKTIHVDEFDKYTGVNTKGSLYENDKLIYASKTKHRYNGDIITVFKDRNGDYTIMNCNERKHTCKAVRFDKNKQMKDVYEEFETPYATYTRRADFHKGALISAETNKKMTILNNMAMDEINIPELAPAAKFVLGKDYKALQGEKTYYSNGMIETNTIKDGEFVEDAYFSPYGELEKLDVENKTIQFDGDNQIITERLDEKAKRITKYHKNKLLSVEYEANGVLKEVNYDDGNIRSYHEKPVDQNDETTKRTSYYFDRNGMLKDTFSY